MSEEANDATSDSEVVPVIFRPPQAEAGRWVDDDGDLLWVNQEGTAVDSILARVESQWELSPNQRRDLVMAVELRSQVASIVAEVQAAEAEAGGVVWVTKRHQASARIADLLVSAPVAPPAPEPGDPWLELTRRVEGFHRAAVDTLNASEGSAEHAAVEASAYGHVLHVMDTLEPPDRISSALPEGDALEQAVAKAIAVSLFGHEVGPSAVAHQIPEARAAIAAYVQFHSEARP